MSQLCKKHGKPRTVIYDKKMPRGGVFTIVGCEDCASSAAAANGVKLNAKPESKPQAIRKF